VVVDHQDRAAGDIRPEVVRVRLTPAAKAQVVLLAVLPIGFAAIPDMIHVHGLQWFRLHAHASSPA
jgi:hypothetical protein